jgi:hypothetical protein
MVAMVTSLERVKCQDARPRSAGSSSGRLLRFLDFVAEVEILVLAPRTVISNAAIAETMRDPGKWMEVEIRSRCNIK